MDKKLMPVDLPQIDENFFKGLSNEKKGEKFYFQLGFFSIKLNLKKEVLEILSKKFENKKNDFNVEPKIFESPFKEFKKTESYPYVYDITFIENKENLIFYAYNFASILNLKNLKECILALGEEKDEKIAGEVENFLRVYSALILPSFDSILLHSSAIVINDKAIVFFGPSGAGKSTIAKLFLKNGYKTLSDDLNILNLEEGKLNVLASPFLSEVKSAEKGRYEVSKIFFLNKAKKNFIKKIPKLSQQAYLYSCLPYLNSIKYFHEEIFKYISKVLNLVEIEVLNFKKDEEIVKWLKSI